MQKEVSEFFIVNEAKDALSEENQEESKHSKTFDVLQSGLVSSDIDSSVEIIDKLSSSSSYVSQ